MPTMKSKSIQIFKPGKHTAMSGAALSFSEADLIATAAAYDPAKHEAPLVCGHPSHDAPAYGWVGGLNFAEGGLDANPTQVNADFAELVSSGAFKKISASFYAPDSPSNPVPGVYYLRHVGFLGAQPPAVKGLRNPSFADAEQGVIEFAEYDDVIVAGIFRRMREFFIEKFGLDAADKAINSYDVSSLEQSARDELKEAQAETATPTPAFAEPTLGDEMSAEDKARLAALEVENKAFKDKEIAFAETQAAAVKAAKHAEHLNFADGLIKQGKLLPIYKELIAATMDYFSAPEQVVEFGEGDEKKPLLDALKGYLTAQPKVVEFGEISGKNGAAQVLSDHEVVRRAHQYKDRLENAGNNISFSEAVDAVNAGKDKE